MPASKVKSSSFMALLMYATLLGVAPSVTSARFRGRNKRKALHRESDEGGVPNAIVDAEEEEEEVEHSGGKGTTGKPFDAELESATTATVSEKKDSSSETLEEKDKTLAVADKETKSAKQRREGEVDDRNSDDFDAGRLSGGAIAAASVMSEHLVTDGQEGPSELEVDDDYDPECVTVGPCLRCEQLELNAEYCKETGRRQEVRCRPRDAPDAFGIVRQEGQVGVVGLPSSVQYRSCEYTDEDELQALVQFWFSMVLLGVVACLGMRRRQKKIRSLYDQRAM